MQHTWQLQEAKARLSALIEQAQKEGPQSITRHGELVAVVISAATYTRLTRPKSSLVSFLASVDFGELELNRDRSDLPRDVEL